MSLYYNRLANVKNLNANIVYNNLLISFIVEKQILTSIFFSQVSNIKW